MEHIVLQVKGMSCGHCVKAVEGAVKSLGAAANVDLGSGSVKIDYEPSRLSLRSIREAIEDQGYDVV